MLQFCLEFRHYCCKCTPWTFSALNSLHLPQCVREFHVNVFCTIVSLSTWSSSLRIQAIKSSSFMVARPTQILHIDSLLALRYVRLDFLDPTWNYGYFNSHKHSAKTLVGTSQSLRTTGTLTLSTSLGYF